MRRRSALLLAACLLLVPALAPAQVTMRNMSLESHWDEYTFTISSYRYSSCWSYVHGDGREYAVLGTAQGTAIYNVTDPANSYRVGFIQGPNSIWREMKSYREWIYVVSEGPGPLEGLQIISMADPENPVLVNTYTATFSLCHTVTVDTTRALLFANGTRFNAGGGSYPNVGTRILSLANPASPVEVGQYGEVGYPGTYAHDSFALGDRLYVSSIYAGRVRVIDVSDPAAPAEITSWTYPGAFTHNAWTDASGDVLYVTDEVNGEPLKIFDISDIMNPVLANQITANPKAIVHNAHVEGDELYLAHYTEGVRILDVSDPLHPAEFAWIDTYPGPSGGFFGVWEVCPYFPSGTVIASDMQTGLYVFRPVRDYGIVRVQVVDQDTQQPLEGVNVYSSTLNDSLVTPASGVAQFAPNPGSDTVLAERFGWTRAAATVDVTSGSRDTVTLILRRKVQVNYSGTLRDAATLAPLDDGEIELSYTPISATTDGAGDFTLQNVPQDIYRLQSRRPGYVPAWSHRAIGPGFTGPVSIDVPAAPIYDDLEAESGWTVGAPGDNATSGIWVRVEPFGTGDPPGSVNPGTDRTPGGTICFVTGQGNNAANIGQADVDNGRTSLTTPALDLSAMADPHIAWWQWFYSNGDANDWFAVRVSNDNGATWTDVDTLRGPLTAASWKERAIRVGDYVTPSAQVRVRFVAADLGAGSIVEAAVDDLIAWDQALVAADVPGAAPRTGLRFRAPHPNPAAGEVTLTLELPVAGMLDVSLYDVSGRRVRVLHRGPAAAGPLALRWDGSDGAGRRMPAGLYFARAESGDASVQTRFVRVE